MENNSNSQQQMPTHFMLDISQRNLLLAYLSDRDSDVSKDLLYMVKNLTGVVAEPKDKEKLEKDKTDPA